MGANAVTSVYDFTAGQILTAAQMDNVNCGIPVFATTTTRDAAFGGTGEKVLAEGQMAYIEANNATQYYDGSSWLTLGPAGLISVAPTSVGKTGASSTATASNNGQVTFGLCETLLLNGVFTSAYSNYRIVWAGFASTGASIYSRMSVGGTPSTAASYSRQQIVASSTTVAAVRDTAQTFWNVANNISTTDGENFSMDIFNPQATKNTSLNVLSHSNASGAYWQSVTATFGATTSFDGIQFYASTGNFSGTITVYGYNQ